MTKNLIKTEGALDKTVRDTINDNIDDVSYSTTQFDAVTGTTGATLTNVVGLSTDFLEVGRYRFHVNLGTVATTNCGIKIGFKQNEGLVVGAIESDATAFAAAASVTARTTTATDAATLIGSTTAVLRVVIEGVLTVTTRGKIQLQAAQNAAHADTTSVFVNSFMTFTKIAAS